MSTSLGDIQILTDIVKDKTVIELGITSIEQKWTFSSSGKRKKMRFLTQYLRKRKFPRF